MKKVLWAAVTAMGMGIMIAGCKGEDIRNENNGGDAGSGSLTVTIKNAYENSASRATGTPTPAVEDAVNSFTVYVFNVSGSLEKSQTFTNVLSGTVSGLSTSTNKNVVVLVNHDELTNLTGYTDLKTRTLTQASQALDVAETNGFFMSGEATNVDLTTLVNNTLTIGVYRAVARVELGSITFLPDAVSNPAQLALNGISMQKVAPAAYLFDGTQLPFTADDYIGGLDGGVSSSNTFLYEAYNPGTITDGMAVSPQIYFYVLPNDNSLLNPTLMTIAATYGTNTAYYTFAINDAASGSGTTDPDGSFIERNMIYTLNITLRSLANYVGDPDDNDLVDVDIVVTVQPWSGSIVQNLVW